MMKTLMMRHRRRLEPARMPILARAGVRPQIRLLHLAMSQLSVSRSINRCHKTPAY